MHSFIPFLLPFATVAFAIPFETTSNYLSPRAACPQFLHVQVDGDAVEEVKLTSENIFSDKFQPSYRNRSNMGCRYQTAHRRNIEDKELGTTVSSTVDIIRLHNGGSFTTKQMDDLKKNYLVLPETFKYGGSTWVQVLRGEWMRFEEYEKKHMVTSSREACQESLAPIVHAVSSYGSAHSEHRPSPFFSDVGLREISNRYKSTINSHDDGLV
ncbi:hypothetical protein FRC03_004025 [Tulasnella sp. 419]|nr:hypothetical protein FRC03_004025 [Tulasnella sp. 419]